MERAVLVRQRQDVGALEGDLGEGRRLAARDPEHLGVDVGRGDTELAAAAARPGRDRAGHVAGAGAGVQDLGRPVGGEEGGKVAEQRAVAAEPAVHRGDVLEAGLELRLVVRRRVEVLAGAFQARQPGHARSGSADRAGSMWTMTSRAPTASATRRSTSSAIACADSTSSVPRTPMVSSAKISPSRPRERTP